MKTMNQKSLICLMNKNDDEQNRTERNDRHWVKEKVRLRRTIEKNEKQSSVKQRGRKKRQQTKIVYIFLSIDRMCVYELCVCAHKYLHSYLTHTYSIETKIEIGGGLNVPNYYFLFLPFFYSVLLHRLFFSKHALFSTFVERNENKNPDHQIILYCGRVCAHAR